jgi:hypothetical protein
MAWHRAVSFVEPATERCHLHGMAQGSVFCGAARRAVPDHGMATGRCHLHGMAQGSVFCGAGHRAVSFVELLTGRCHLHGMAQGGVFCGAGQRLDTGARGRPFCAEFQHRAKASARVAAWAGQVGEKGKANNSE